MVARVNLILAAMCFAVAIGVTGVQIARATGSTNCELIAGACVDQGCPQQDDCTKDTTTGDCHCTLR